MIETQNKLDEILIEAGLLKLDKLKEAWDIQRRTDKSLDEILLELRYVSTSDINKAKAQSMGVEYVELKDYEQKASQVTKSITKIMILKHSILPLEIRDKTLVVAMKDPKNIFILDDLKLTTAMEIHAVYADPAEIDKMIDKLYVEKEKEAEKEAVQSANKVDALKDIEATKLSAGKKNLKGGKEFDENNIFAKNKVFSILVDEGIVNGEQFDKALEIQNAEGGSIESILIKEGFVEKKIIYSILAKQIGAQYIELENLKIPEEVLSLVNENLTRRHMLVPIEKDGMNLKVAMSDPTNIFSIDDLRLATGMEIVPFLADAEDIRIIHDRKKSKEKKAAEQSAKPGKDVKPKNLDFEEEIKKVNEEIEIEIKDEFADENVDISDVQNAPIVKMVNLIFNKAVQNKSSDIHIEPYEDCVMVRNRVDGQLVEVMKHDRKIHQALVARIKIISGLNIAERRLPQDGRISIKLDGRDFDMRVSILPTVHGEKVVIRLADKQGFNVNKQELGFFDDDLQKFDEILKHPHGIVLVTGPTGSGKSTTLYTALKELCKPNINILTVEDPVENTVKGINQVQVNTKAGLNFAMALRSFLRQDPDIIMVGEIRDSETAEIAIRAAITGHLVLSTLHTNDAASTVTRVIDMGIEPYMISSSLVGIIAQRLVRRLCPKCREEYEPTATDKDILKIAEGEEVKIYKAKGCPECGNIGYKGRTAIYEIMTMNRELIDIISRNEQSNILKEAAVRNGMKTLRDNCGRLVKEGVTTMDELFRVTFSQD